MTVINQPSRIILNAPNQGRLATAPSPAKFNSRSSRINKDSMDILSSLEQGASIYGRSKRQAERKARIDAEDQEKYERQRREASRSAFNANSADNLDLLFSEVDHEYASSLPDDYWSGVTENPRYEALLVGVADEDRPEYETLLKQKAYSRSVKYMEVARDRATEEQIHNALRHISTNTEWSKEQKDAEVETLRSHIQSSIPGSAEVKDLVFSARTAHVIQNHFKAGNYDAAKYLLESVKLSGEESIGLAEGIRNQLTIMDKKKAKADAKFAWEQERNVLLYSDVLDSKALFQHVTEGVKHDPSLSDPVKRDKFYGQLETLFHENKVEEQLLDFAIGSDAVSRTELQTQAQFMADRYEHATGVTVDTGRFIDSAMQVRRQRIAELTDVVEIQPQDQDARLAQEREQKAYLQLAPEEFKASMSGLFTTVLETDIEELPEHVTARVDSLSAVLEAFNGDAMKAGKAYFPKNPELREKLYLYDMAYRFFGSPISALKLATTEERVPLSKTFRDGAEAAVTDITKGYPDFMKHQMKVLLEALGTRKGMPLEVAKDLGKVLLKEQTVELGDRHKFYGQYGARTFDRLSREALRFAETYHVIAPSPFRSDEETAKEVVEDMLDKYLNMNQDILKARFYLPDDLDMDKLSVQSWIHPDEFMVFYDGQLFSMPFRFTSEELLEGYKKGISESQNPEADSYRERRERIQSALEEATSEDEKARLQSLSVDAMNDYYRTGMNSL